MVPRTTSVARSSDARSAPEHAVILVAIVAMPSSASPRPAPSSASLSGIISAAGSTSQVSASFHHCPTSSVAEANPPDLPARGFAPVTQERLTCAVGGLGRVEVWGIRRQIAQGGASGFYGRLYAI